MCAIDKHIEVINSQHIMDICCLLHILVCLSVCVCVSVYVSVCVHACRGDMHNNNRISVSLQKGKIIDNWTIVMDLENLSYQRHYYWPSESPYIIHSLARFERCC